MKKIKSSLIRKIAIFMICIFAIFAIRNIYVYATTETTAVVCNDSNMYKALTSKLSSTYVLSTDSSTKTINVITDYLPEITTLNLSGFQISDLTGIENFTYLTSLDISNNSITTLSKISGLTSLTTLNASTNQISSVSTISGLTNLTELNLSSNGSISSISSLSNMKNLTILKLASTGISDISVIQNFTSLSELDLSQNSSITDIDSAIVSSLTSLNLSSTGITKIKTNDNDEYSKLVLTGKNLKALYLANNTIQDLYQIYSTEEVTMHDSYGNEYTENLARLRKLEILDLNNQGNTDGIDFGNLQLLTGLKELYLQNDNIYGLDGITKLSDLEYIDLTGNNIDSLENILKYEYDDNGNRYISEKLSATQIVLRQNNLSEINELYYLNQIEYLDLSENSIQNITPIEKFTNLDETTLFLQDQNLTMNVYSKKNEKDQYIILYNTMQSAKSSSSIIYDEEAYFTTSTSKLTMNTESIYQKSPNYNVIIDSSYFEENGYDYETDELYVTLHGGIADGTTMRFYIESWSDSIDSIYFKDENLASAIYSYVSNNEDVYIAQAGNILNIERWVIEDTTTLDLSDKNITYLEGLSNFSALQNLNLSGNNVSDDSEIKYLTDLQVLNLANNKLDGSYSSIENLYNLTNLNIAGNNIQNLNSLNNLLNNQVEAEYDNQIKILTISNNNITDIESVAKLSSLTSLSMSYNSVEDISWLESNENLTTLDASNNKIEDISVLSKLTNIVYLYLSNNNIEDISSLSNLTLTGLNLSGNNIKDISVLKNQRNLTNLYLSNNKIADITPIETLVIKGNCELSQQKLTESIGNNKSGTITVALPEIFISAEGNSSYGTSSKAYTSSGFKYTNCTLSSDGTSITIDLDTLNGEVAEVSIINGNAIDSTFTVAEELKGTITYDVTEPTNESVTAIISFNRANVTILNNDGENTYTFDENGTFTFLFEDDYGFEGEATAEVDWIDKTGPVATVSYSPSSYTNGDVTVTIESDEVIQSVEGWNYANTAKTSISKTYEENKTEIVALKDELGNATNVTVTVDKIDKTAPVITGVEDGKEYTEAVTPVVTDENIDTVTLTRGGSTVSNWTSGKKITTSGEYVLTATDKAGNSTTVTFTLTVDIEEVDDTIYSSTYTVDDTNLYITDTTVGTTVEEFKENIDTEVEYTITDKDGNTIEDGTTMATGYKLVTETDKEYLIAVKGDVTGDGKLDISDVSMVASHVVDKYTIEGIYAKAADVVSNSNIDISDLSKLASALVGKATL